MLTLPNIDNFWKLETILLLKKRINMMKLKIMNSASKDSNYYRYDLKIIQNYFKGMAKSSKIN